MEHGTIEFIVNIKVPEVLPRVKGRCPMGCGQTLCLGNDGYVTCSYSRCPEPEAASKLLEAQSIK